MPLNVGSITEVFNAEFVRRDVQVYPAFGSLGVGTTELRTWIAVPFQNLMCCAKEFLAVEGFGGRSTGFGRPDRGESVASNRLDGTNRSRISSELKGCPFWRVS